MTKVIGDYSAAATIDGTAHFLLIQPGTSSAAYNKISRNVYLGLSSAPLGLTDSQNPTNKTFNNTNAFTIKDGSLTLQNTADTTKQAVFSLSGNTTGTTRTYTMPNASVTLASLTGTETLTNKTITAPAITGGTIDNSAITVDSISGHSSATTVTVANLQILNGVLNTANAVTSTSIAIGAVQPQALVTGTGTGWAYQSYTPTFSNFTLGNGTISARYTQVGKVVIARGVITLGTTSSMGTSPTMTLPVTSASASYSAGATEAIGQGVYQRAGIGFYNLAWCWASTTTSLMNTLLASGTYTSLAGVTSTVPNTWASTDTFTWDITYEAA